VADAIPQKFDNVTVHTKANCYFDNKVVSHTVMFGDGKKKTIGLIFAGSFKFNTDAPEKMEIVAGSCRVKVEGDKDWKTYAAGTAFRVKGKSYFEIAVESGAAEYVCSFE